MLFLQVQNNKQLISLAKQRNVKGIDSLRPADVSFLYINLYSTKHVYNRYIDIIRSCIMCAAMLRRRASPVNPTRPANLGNYAALILSCHGQLCKHTTCRWVHLNNTAHFNMQILVSPKHMCKHA